MQASEQVLLHHGRLTSITGTIMEVLRMDISKAMLKSRNSAMSQASRAAEETVRTPFHPRTPHKSDATNRNQDTERSGRLPRAGCSAPLLWGRKMVSSEHLQQTPTAIA
jgi:hypothetical protein